MDKRLIKKGSGHNRRSINEVSTEVCGHVEGQPYIPSAEAAYSAATCEECIHFMPWDDGDGVCIMTEGWWAADAADTACEHFMPNNKDNRQP